MPKQFKGTVNLDVRDSTPDWDAFVADRAPEGAPNVLVVLYDDTGCAAWSPYGERINVPADEHLFDYVEADEFAPGLEEACGYGAWRGCSDGDGVD
jgi:hypothetical protein